MIDIRLAKSSDAEGILKIYAPYVLHHYCTFESEVPSLREMEQRIEIYSQKRPWIVCVVNDTIAGYVYASGYRERAAYQWSCEWKKTKNLPFC